MNPVYQDSSTADRKTNTNYLRPKKQNKEKHVMTPRKQKVSILEKQVTDKERLVFTWYNNSIY